jgi:ABC-type lipoprotein export system ATPase subunit
MNQPTQRGSLWRVWDFHAHTPASHQWDGAKLDDAPSQADREVIIANTVKAMRDAEPDVIVIMDYWTFDGYLAIKDYVQKNPGALGNKVVMPGIEIRVESSHPKQRLNVHFVIDPELKDQCFADLLGSLKISLGSRDRGVSKDCFIEWARGLGTDKLNEHSFDVDRVGRDDKYALLVGKLTAEVTSASAHAALECLPLGTGLMLMPWDTYGGMRGIDWAKHYAEVRRLMQADIFECKDIASRECFHGQKTANNEEFFNNFWDSIGKEARLCVRGTDAHSFSKYGVFPSGMKTWLKAEPTFLGLKQAIKEPVFRSFIGDIPPKKAMVEANGSLFMDRLRVKKKLGALPSEDWFDGLDIELNPDLVAIIGNKGSGKSAMADLLALAGNSKLQSYFTFLNPDRFKAGGSKRAGAFDIDLTWCNNDVTGGPLDSQMTAGKPERIRYISQRYFDELCNEHVTGKSDRFAQEIKGVLFSKMEPAEKLSFENLDAYLASQENTAKERLTQLRARLHDVNAAIAIVDFHQTAAYQNELNEKLATKQLLLGDLEGQQPAEVLAPPKGTESTTESKRLDEINQLQATLNIKIVENDAVRKACSEHRQALKQALERIVLFQNQAQETGARITEDLASAGISIENPITLHTKVDEISELYQVENRKIIASGELLEELNGQVTALKQERDALQEKLDGPSKTYQLYLTALKAWEEQKSALVGTHETTDSLAYCAARIEELNKLPEQRKALEDQRSGISLNIYKELKSIADSRKPLFKPVEQIVADFPEVQKDLRIDFQSRLFFDRGRFFEEFFRLVKQNTGGFRGDPEGQTKLDSMIRATDFESEQQVVALLNAICAELITEAKLPIQQMMRTGVTPQQFYDMVFGLEHLDPKFSLSLTGTTMPQMSPGQRGSLLLIFYLLVDSDQTPLVLDQPEENLDNQTVYSMLVPVIQRAKQRRQIIMVTHNANLAVCCDAEQIVHAEFDRANHFKLRYSCGAIETPAINKSVVDVLEGTTPAFVNRKGKYLKSAN